MRVVITRNLLKPLAAVAFVIALGLVLTASTRTRATAMLLVGLAGCLSALLLRLSVLPRGGLWGYSARSTLLTSIGVISMATSELPTSELGSAQTIVTWIGGCCFIVGLLLSSRDRQTSPDAARNGVASNTP